ncbi:flagellin lysine-N-methylase [Sansalvadorimonas sp. 2012CJ34-2]|uniref:Flagellin lysine-N-methylase n=1 Tax=Parendozoicomonas callyspongiae TaxID=2942213 RepID=A0ABT0PFE1_9GAMM|nr:flagellin lysine-N-methylase [Sansalvadorimonas sp. 2012CJ34-2]MCL6270093.1 flagellin lysine-N-methylase [Sansalvadorimonas sp. 2012CJ34-2]
MPASQNQVLYPKFYRDFSCIGPNCEHHCCQSWRITIDKKTYKIYKKSTDPVLRDITRNQMSRPRQQTDHEYRLINLKSDSSCPLQNKDGTCYIHCNHGEKLLSATCKTYPRQTKSLTGKIEPSLSLSCPEAARKILLDPSAMMFETDPEAKIESGLILSTYNNVPDHFDAFRQTAFQAVLGEEECPDERLFHLGALFSLVAKRENSGDILAACQTFFQMREDKLLNRMYAEATPNIKGQAHLLKQLMEKLQFFKHNKVLEGYHQQFVDNLKEKFGEHGSVNMEQLLADRQQHYTPLIEDCGHGLVNMMLHWLYTSDICHKTGEELLAGYAEFTLKYILIRFYLQMLAEPGHYKELLVGIVHSMSRSADHNQEYLKSLHANTVLMKLGSHAQIMSLLK